MPEIVNAQLRGAVEHLITQVNPDNVLAVRKVLLEEVSRLKKEIDKNSTTSGYVSTGLASGVMGTSGVGYRIGRCSDDPISAPAQVSFQRKIDAVVANCRSYIRDLNAAAEHLTHIARQYDISEDEITRSFARITT